MASSSSAAHLWKYDVFLSFRGKDTRNNFTSHLYDALCHEKIKTFIDDGLERGEEITPALLKTIEESRISVVIFSKNYASSSWCVDELVKILECKQSHGQIVLPVFYHVDPSDVDEQTGSFGNAFAELEKQFKGKMEKVPRWRTELTKAANISGWDSQVTSPESKLVREVVETIRKKLNRASPSELRGLVGMASRIEQINKLLSIRSSDVCTVGIWGMGGIGKTTVAEAFFHGFSSQYESCHFLLNIREESEKGELVRVRDEFLSKLLEEENLHIDTPHIGPTFVKDRICQKKVLLVLDDVNDVCQFQLLIERCDLFGAGSVILVTSRDQQVLKNVVDEIYKVEKLNFHEALQLFSLNAFKRNQLPKAYMELSINAINYAKGNPLALRVLGSFLFGKGRHFWESQLNELERIPELNIYDLLRIGFDALRDNNMKSIFLDIACFFKGHQVDFVKRILDGCGFKTEIGFSVLSDRCLIKISNDKVEMHDLLQEMAHDIVRQESLKELGRQSRLWSPKDVYQVLTKNLGTGKVEGIFFDVSKVREMELSSRAFARMYNLRLLKIYNSEVERKCVVHLPHGLEYLSDELRYLHWDEYPLTSLPSSFCPENLVELNLSSSKVKQLWKGDHNLANLKDVNLSSCKFITFMPDLSKAKNLERLNLQFCASLAKVPSSIQHLDKLIDLDLRDCTSLISLPSRINSRRLMTLNLSGCSNLKKCPQISGKMTYLNLNETAIEELPQSIGDLSELVALNLKNCKNLGNLPENIFLLKSLQIVDICGCSSISRFPDFSRNIRYLYLNGTGIEELPSSIGGLRELISLNLIGCNRLKDLPSTISKLGCLEKLDLSGCSSITEFPKVSRNIRELYLDGTAIREIPSSIGRLSELAELHLRNCRKFEILPSSICKLKYLRRLNLSGCLQFKNFPEVLEPMERLRYLYLDRTQITKLPSPIGNLMGLSCLEVGMCVCLKGIECLVDLQLPENNMDLKFLRQLNLDGCSILEVPDTLGCLSSLEVLDLSGNHFQTLPISINRLFELQYLGLRKCTRLQSLPELPPRLVKLDAHYCRVMRSVSSSSTVVEGNVFEFIFTRCQFLDETQCEKILAYSLLKFLLYTERQYNQVPDIPAGTSSACFPCFVTPMWFIHQSWGSTVTIQLSSHWANSEFLGFTLCAIIAFSGTKCSLQVKCTYHFRNKHGDCHDLYCYLHGWNDEKSIYSEHMLVGFDPCLVAIKDDLFGEYTEVSIEFQAEDLCGNLLPLDCCQILECGVRLLYTKDEIRHFDFTMAPLQPHPDLFFYDFGDQDSLESWFKAKRAHDDAISPMGNLMGLSCLEVGNCIRLKGIECFVDLRLLESDADLKLLRELNLDGCSIWEVPDGLGFLSSLVVLDLSGNHFQTLPISINKLFELQYLGLRNCKRLQSLPELPPRLVKLDAHNCQFLSRVSSSSTVAEGNLFGFIFTDCRDLQATQCEKILAYSLLKFQLYTKRQYNQVPNIPAGTSSACFPGSVIPTWFSHQCRESTVTIQLSSHWAKSEFLGFALCAIIAFRDKCSLQVKCTYHFRNKHGNCHDLYCYLHGWYDEKRILSYHTLVGFDPCLVAIKDDLFSEYTEVTIEFQAEDLDGNCSEYSLIIGCGFRLLYAEEEIPHFG